MGISNCCQPLCIDSTSQLSLVPSRDVITGATGATAVAPKFLDTLTRFCPPLQRLQLTFSSDYVPALDTQQEYFSSNLECIKQNTKRHDKFTQLEIFVIY